MTHLALKVCKDAVAALAADAVDDALESRVVASCREVEGERRRRKGSEGASKGYLKGATQPQGKRPLQITRTRYGSAHRPLSLHAEQLSPIAARGEMPRPRQGPTADRARPPASGRADNEQTLLPHSSGVFTVGHDAAA